MIARAVSQCPRRSFKKYASPIRFATASATEWTRAIDEKNADVNAVVFRPPVINSGPQNSRLALHNVAVAVKDNICSASMPTTCSSNVLRNFQSPYNATVVELLHESGAEIVGKTNCDEFGMGSLNIYSVHGAVVNPHQAPSSVTSWSSRERRSAGGSSGGSAAAVASGMCHAALATDTGGSTRLPASYCGVVGHKPSYGLISRWGVVSFADSLDCVGIIAQNVDYADRVFGVLSRYDPKDPSAAKPETRQRAQQECQKNLASWGSDMLQGLRVGIPQEYFPAELQPSILKPIRRVLDSLKSRGVLLVPVSLPATPYALSAYYVIASAEASSNMARYDGIQFGLRVDPPQDVDKTKTANVYAHTRSRGFGKEVQKRILLGTYALTADAFDNYFLQAQRVRNLVRSDFDHVFRVVNVLDTSNRRKPREDGVDVLLHPSAIRTAPPLDIEAPLGLENGLEAYVQDVLTVPASLAGLPAMSIPAGLGEDGWPVGVSVVGQWGCDEMVIRVCKAIESFQE